MFQPFKKWIRNNFGFSRAETNGFLIILLVMLVAMFVPFIYKAISRGPMPDPQDRLLLDSLIAQFETPPTESLPITKDSLFVFDPNSAGLFELKRLGLSNFISNNILKYREHGGSFKYKESLAKVYGMNDSILQSLSNFIDLPDQPQLILSTNHEQNQSTTSSEPTNHISNLSVFNINSADTIDLKRINGIGSVLSNRVIKYRNLLGGFYSKEQYSEVYNLEPEVVSRLKRYTEIRPVDCCRKLKINSLGWQDLMRHPYLNSSQAQAIIAYRQQHGGFERLEELKKVHLVDPNTFTKIYPYLEL